MPIHDWGRVEAGIFHHFHHCWIGAISHALNAGLLPSDYYAMAEQQAAGFGPDVLTLQGGDGAPPAAGAGGAAVAARPRTRFTFETDAEFYRRKKSGIAVRHVTGDRVVSMIEIVSPGNKSSRQAFRGFLNKAGDLLEARVHLLFVDLLPPTKRDPNGLHSAIWDEAGNEPFVPPPDNPLTLAAYECGLTTRAYVEPAAVGDRLPDMPLFLEPGLHVAVPLEATYMAAWGNVPLRWRRVVEPG